MEILHDPLRDRLRPWPRGLPGQSRSRRLAALAALAMLGLSIVAATLLSRNHPADAAAADVAAADIQADATLAAAIARRIDGLESRLALLTAEMARAEIARAPQADRFFAAALMLQAAIGASRPYLREYEMMLALAPRGALAPSLGEALASHAVRGVPTEADLRERFAVLIPRLTERAPHDGGTLGRAGAWLRGGIASIGLVAPPAPSGTESALDGIAEHLRRGNLAAAAADAASLDAAVQPLLSGWLAQARARLAVEQAIRETLLHALAPGNLHPANLQPANLHPGHLHPGHPYPLNAHPASRGSQAFPTQAFPPQAFPTQAFPPRSSPTPAAALATPPA